MSALLVRTFDKDRLTTLAIWVVMISLAWSLPLVSWMQREAERAKIESGVYYTPKKPAEYYVVR